MGDGLPHLLNGGVDAVAPTLAPLIHLTNASATHIFDAERLYSLNTARGFDAEFCVCRERRLDAATYHTLLFFIAFAT